MYQWRMQDGKVSAEGTNKTLHDAIDQMVYYSRGQQVRDFYVNGYHMNEEFGLWIDGGKVVHDDGTDFVPMNEWYDALTGGEDSLNRLRAQTDLYFGRIS